MYGSLPVNNPAILTPVPRSGQGMDGNSDLVGLDHLALVFAQEAKSSSGLLSLRGQLHTMENIRQTLLQRDTFALSSNVP